MEFTFESAPWETELEQLEDGSAVSAVRLLPLMEQEDEETVEQILLSLEQRQIRLDVSDLPKDPGGGETAVRLALEERLSKAGTLLENLEENDPLRLYLQEVAATPATGDPQLMAEQFAQGQETVGECLTNRMLSLVIQQAMQMTGNGVLLMDLIQEGSLGLWQAILHFEQGDFTQQCRWWIDQYIAKAVFMQARAGGLGEKLRRGMEDYLDVDGKLLTELGRNPTAAEIAEQMHITEAEVAVYEDMLQAAKLRSRVDAQREPAEPTPEDEQAVEDTAYFQSRQRIMELLSALTPQQVQVLNLRFGLEGGMPMTPQQVGQRLGMGADEVVAMEAAALAQLREQ